MTKLIPFVVSLVLLQGCSGNNEKNKPAVKTEERIPAANSESPEESTVREWLQGKEWKTESEAAPVTMMKLFPDGMGEFLSGKDPWLYKDGFFAIRDLNFVKWPLKKIDEQTFTLFVESAQKTYTYKFVQNL